MRLISIPFSADSGGRVLYEGGAENWRGAERRGELLVGHYVGELYQADGVTKRFAWSDYVEAAPAEPWAWFIDHGPFFNRFGPFKGAILASAHPVIQAVVKDAQSRKWIDLQDPEVADSIDMIIDTGAIPGLDEDVKNAVLTTPVALEHNFALRKLYFS